jgi:DNA processing protein
VSAHAPACSECLRHTWLVGTVSARLVRHARDPERLLGLLALPAEELARAVGGRWRESLLAQLAHPDAATAPAAEGVQRLCRHDPRYPAALARRADAPRTLHVAGGVERLRELLAGPAVAIVGARRASDYGMEVAHGLARGLAASGVTVVSALAEGVPAAAHLGALHAGGPTVTVTAGGADVPHPASWRALHRRLAAEGCALAELPCGAPPRAWCHPARARTVAALARVVIVVEAGEELVELLTARLAAAAGTLVAAVPGRVGAPGARGPHLLLREGALLVRGPEDALDALYGVGPAAYGGLRAAARAGPRAAGEGYLPAAEGGPPAAAGGGVPAAATLPEVEPHLRAVLDRVGAGQDTVAKLEAAGARTHDVLAALAELECRGALVRGDGGRYLVALGSR